MNQTALTSHAARRGLIAAFIGLVVMLLTAGAAFAQEAGDIHSNGLGGGDWSNPATWRGGKVPGPKDDVTISAGDLVIFDQDHTDSVSCANIFIDPRSVLAFKNNPAKKVMSVGGNIESYGAIRMGVGASRVDPDPNGDPRDVQQLRMVGPTAEKRMIQLTENGSLLVYGARRQIDNKPNITIYSGPAAPNTPPIQASIRAGKSNMIDIQRARVENTYIYAKLIDNTGAKANERFNISSSQFLGIARIQMESCDTPTVVNNDFEAGEGVTPPAAAITLSYSPLADIRGNTIKGAYPIGIQGVAQPDSNCSDNTVINGASAGIHWYGANSILKKNTITNCPIGYVLTHMSGVVEESVITGAKVGIEITNSNAQVTNVFFKDLVKENGKAVSISSASGIFLNCNLNLDMLHIWGGNPEIPVTVRDYLVVKVTWPGQKEGKPAPGSNGKQVWVEVWTNNPKKPLKPGEMDPNVINSPAKVDHRTGMTPLPESLEALVINSWGANKAGKLAEPYEYKVRIGVAPDADDKTNDTMKELKSLVIKPQPDWYRGMKDSGKPTVEVELK